MMAEQYSKESKAEDLEGSDAKVYDTLIKMGGNKKESWTTLNQVENFLLLSVKK
jgi:hypothetical protein